MRAPALRLRPGHGRTDAARLGDPEPSWQWPVDITRYDRSPRLTPSEASALTRIGDEVRAWPHRSRQGAVWRAVERLVCPLADVRGLVVSQTPRQRRCADAAVAAILRECAHEQSAYWGWSPSTWLRILGATQRDFRAAHPVWVDRQVRHYLIALPYLLGCFTDLRPLGNYQRVALAEKVFGPARVQAIVTRVATVLDGWGYQNAQAGRAFPRILCETLLLNRSPRLHDLSPARLDDLRRTAGPEKHSGLHQLQRALAALGIMDAPPAPVVPRPAVEGVARRTGRTGRIAGKPPPRSPPPRGGMSASAS